MARTKKSSKDRRSVSIHVLATEADHSRLHAAAKKARASSLSSWLLNQGLRAADELGIPESETEAPEEQPEPPKKKPAKK